MVFFFLSVGDGIEGSCPEHSWHRWQRPGPSRLEDNPRRLRFPLQDPAKPDRPEDPQRRECRVFWNQSSKFEQWRKNRSQGQVHQAGPVAPARVGRRLWGIETPQAQRGRQQVAQPAS